MLKTIALCEQFYNKRYFLSRVYAVFRNFLGTCGNIFEKTFFKFRKFSP
jgi:hypothetical protein